MILLKRNVWYVIVLKRNARYDSFKRNARYMILLKRNATNMILLKRNARYDSFKKKCQIWCKFFKAVLKHEDRNRNCEYWVLCSQDCGRSTVLIELHQQMWNIIFFLFSLAGLNHYKNISCKTFVSDRAK